MWCLFIRKELMYVWCLSKENWCVLFVYQKRIDVCALFIRKKWCMWLFIQAELVWVFAVFISQKKKIDVCGCVVFVLSKKNCVSFVYIIDVCGCVLFVYLKRINPCVCVVYLFCLMICVFVYYLSAKKVICVYVLFIYQKRNTGLIWYQTT